MNYKHLLNFHKTVDELCRKGIFKMDHYANQAGELNFEIPGVGAPKMHRDISFRKV